MIKLSIILFVCNDKNNLRNTLNSIIKNKSFNDDEVECIIVDKNSEDNTKEICKEYIDSYSYFKYFNIEHPTSKGYSESKNFGKKIATGKFIHFISCNNILNDYIKVACDFLENNSDYDYFISNRIEYGSTWTYSDESFSMFGPILDSCVFKREILATIDFEDILDEDIIYTKLIELNGFKYYYDKSKNAISSFVGGKNEVIHTSKYDNWRCNPVEHLQYCETYPYCLDSNNNIIKKAYKPIPYFDFLATNKCNLSCASCSAFSPCVENGEFFEIDKILNDLQKIEKYKDDVRTVVIVGGECTLHPQLSSIVAITRKIFPNNEIEIVTNGTTYKSIIKLQDCLLENHITVLVSLYPIPEVEEIRKTFTELFPPSYLRMSSHAIDGGFYHKHLGTATHCETDKILQCIKRTIMRVRDGKVYVCHYADELKNLKNKFGDKIKITDDGAFIELNENTQLEDLLKLKNEIIPEICYHCLDVLQENTAIHVKQWETFPWYVSEKKIEEFYIE